METNDNQQPKNTPKQRRETVERLKLESWETLIIMANELANFEKFHKSVLHIYRTNKKKNMYKATYCLIQKDEFIKKEILKLKGNN